MESRHKTGANQAKPEAAAERSARIKPTHTLTSGHAAAIQASARMQAQGQQINSLFENNVEGHDRGDNLTQLQSEPQFSQAKLKGRQIPVTQFAPLANKKLNIAGEIHNESDKRRDLEKAYSSEKTGGDYWTEGEFKIDGGFISTPEYGDPFLLRAEQLFAMMLDKSVPEFLEPFSKKQMPSALKPAASASASATLPDNSANSKATAEAESSAIVTDPMAPTATTSSASPAKPKAAETTILESTSKPSAASTTDKSENPVSPSAQSGQQKSSMDELEAMGFKEVTEEEMALNDTWIDYRKLFQKNVSEIEIAISKAMTDEQDANALRAGKASAELGKLGKFISTSKMDDVPQIIQMVKTAASLFASDVMQKSSIRSTDEVSTARSDVMHRVGHKAAPGWFGFGKAGLWKVGNAHANDLITKKKSEGGDYEVMDRSDFNTDFEKWKNAKGN